MATFSKVSHISFSVRDAETSARWWAELLDLTEIDRVSGNGWQGVLLLHPTSRTVIERSMNGVPHFSLVRFSSVKGASNCPA